jgi:hypothetical protein
MKPRSTFCTASFVLTERLAHQLISGSSMTACHTCMHSADDRGDGVTLFAGARDANRILEQPVAPLPDPAGPEALKSRRGLRCGGHVWRGLSHDGAVGYQARFDIAPE